MKQPLHIVFLGMAVSPSIEAAARAKAGRLERFCPDLMSCRVAVERAHKHQRQGCPVEVRVDVRLPGHELSVSRVSDEDAHVALRDAFDDMQRKIEDTVRRQRGQVKTHAGRPTP
jgi:ribosome-associated translation inhibitor RaiA